MLSTSSEWRMVGSHGEGIFSGITISAMGDSYYGGLTKANCGVLEKRKPNENLQESYAPPHFPLAFILPGSLRSSSLVGEIEEHNRQAHISPKRNLREYLSANLFRPFPFL